MFALDVSLCERTRCRRLCVSPRTERCVAAHPCRRSSESHGVQGVDGTARRHVPDGRRLGRREVRGKSSFAANLFLSACTALVYSATYLPRASLPCAHVRLIAAARLARQGVLGKELCCCQGCFPEAANPCAREQRQPRVGHRHLRCALPHRKSAPRYCSDVLTVHARVCVCSRCPPLAEFGVEKTVDVEGMSADAFKSQLETLMKASS